MGELLLVNCVRCSQRFPRPSPSTMQMCPLCTSLDPCKLRPHLESLASSQMLIPKVNPLQPEDALRFNSKRKYLTLQYQVALQKSRPRLSPLETDVALQHSELKSTFLSLQFDPILGASGGDVFIVIQGLTEQPLRAHKFILACRSPVLCKIFATNMLETETGIFRVNDTTLPIMRAVVKFCYDSQIEFTDEVTSEAVLKVAHEYELNLLMTICVPDLARTTTRANLAKRLKLARKFELRDLEAASCQFLKTNFDAVIRDVLGELC